MTSLAFSTSTSSLRNGGVGAGAGATHQQHQQQQQHTGPLAGPSTTMPIPTTTTTTIMSYADSPLIQLPQVTIPFDDLRRRMAEFSVKFDTFIERARKRVLEERNEYKARISEIHEDQRSTSAQITSLRTALSAHAHVVARETAEKHEITAQIRELQQHSGAQEQRREGLRRQIEAVRGAIAHKEAAQREYARRVEAQQRLNAPELLFWQAYLAVRIEGAGDEGRIRVVYLFPPAAKRKNKNKNKKMGGKRKEDDNDDDGNDNDNDNDYDDNDNNDNDNGEEREAAFELKVPDTTTGEYQVVYSRPRLDQDKVARVVARLNETREIGVLLKGMRALFAEGME